MKMVVYLIGDEFELFKGFLVKKIKDIYQFYYDFVMEVIILIFGIDYFKIVIKYVDIGFFWI